MGKAPNGLQSRMLSSDGRALRVGVAGSRCALFPDGIRQSAPRPGDAVIRTGILGWGIGRAAGFRFASSSAPGPDGRTTSPRRAPNDEDFPSTLSLGAGGLVSSVPGSNVLVRCLVLVGWLSRMEHLAKTFLDPSSPAQRRYEALRACYVDGVPVEEAAARFGYSVSALRNLVADFAEHPDRYLPPSRVVPEWIFDVIAAGEYEG